MKINTAILTLSDSRTKRTDLSKLTIEDILGDEKFIIKEYELLKDEFEIIKSKLSEMCNDENINLILTTGGTGFGSRDVTPEATEAILEKRLDGISEYIRAEGAKKTKRALLSRAVAGICNKTLIINLPGSPKGAKESLECIVDLIPHALDMIYDKGH